MGGGWVGTQTAGSGWAPQVGRSDGRVAGPAQAGGTPAGALLAAGAAAARRAAPQYASTVLAAGRRAGRRESRSAGDLGAHAVEARRRGGAAPPAPTVASVGVRHELHCRSVDGGWRMTGTQGVVVRLRERTAGGRHQRMVGHRRAAAEEVPVQERRHGGRPAPPHKRAVAAGTRSR